MIYEPSNVSPSFSAVDLYTHDNNPVRKPLPVAFVVHTDTNSPVINATVNIYSSEGVEYSNLSISGITYPLYEGSVVNGGINIGSTSMDNGRSYSFSITLKTSTPNIFMANGILETAISSGATTITLPAGVVAANLMNDNDNYIQIGTELLKIKSVDETTNTITLNSAVQNSYNKGTAYTLYTNQFTSAQYYFTTAWNPEVIIYGATTGTVTQKSYTCHALYSTNINNLSYNYYEWSLYSGGDLLDTYRNSTPVEGSIGEHTYYNFAWELDGLINGNEYTVELYVEWQNGMTSQAEPITFTVQYEMGDLDIPVQYDLLCDQSGIQVSWQHNELIQSNGVISGNVGTGYQYVPDEPWEGNSSVLLSEPSQLSYIMTDVKGYPISFPHVQNKDEGHDGSYFFHVKLSPNMQAGTIIKLEAQPIQIIDLSDTVPTSGMSEGSFYINTTDNKLYQYTNNAWDKIGVPLNVGDIYQLGTLYYTFDGDKIIPITTSERPYTEIKWDGVDKFTWRIHIVTEDSYGGTLGEYQVPAPVAAWLLQPQNANKSLKYQWDDTASWDDSLYWIEQDKIDNFFARSWFKIGIYNRTVNFEYMYESEYEEPKYHLFYYLGDETTTWTAGHSSYGATTFKYKDHLHTGMTWQRETFLAQVWAVITGGLAPKGVDLSQYSGVGMVGSYSNLDPEGLLEITDDDYITSLNDTYHFNDILRIGTVIDNKRVYKTLIGLDKTNREAARVMRWGNANPEMFTSVSYIELCCGINALYTYNRPNPPAYTDAYAVFGTQPDNWQFLCALTNITGITDLNTLVNNHTYMNKIFNSYSAVQYMYKVCTGDFMANVLSNEITYQWLKESPYYQEVKDSDHWGLFINLMENDTPSPTPFPSEWNTSTNNQNYSKAGRQGYNSWYNIVTNGGTGNLSYIDDYGYSHVATSNIGMLIWSKTPLDLTKVNSISVGVDFTSITSSAPTVSFMISSTRGLSTQPAKQPDLVKSQTFTFNTPTSGTYTFNVNDLTGQYYVSIGVCGTNSFNSAYQMELNNIVFNTTE